MNCGNYMIDIGCGPAKQEGYIGVDKHDYSNLYKEDFICRDIEKHGLPFCDNSANEIWARDVMEHIHDLIFVMNECWRVLKPDGIITISVPLFGTAGSIKDPTHVRFFLPETFSYFENEVRIENYGLKRWKIVSDKKNDGSIKIIMKAIK